jgi:hypothetical protein
MTATTETTRQKLFINYRRSETSGVAEKLKLALHRQFHESAVFLDAHSIPSGEYWAQNIAAALAESAVVIVLIGGGWLKAIDSAGTIRLHNDDDWVRHEIEIALRNAGTVVIPVVLEDTPIPATEDLPISLQALPTIQAFRLSASNWDTDVAKLIARIFALSKVRTRSLGFEDVETIFDQAAVANPNIAKIAGLAIGLVAFYVVLGAGLVYWAGGGTLFILATIANVAGLCSIGGLVVFSLYWRDGKVGDLGPGGNVAAKTIAEMYGDTNPNLILAPLAFFFATGVFLLATRVPHGEALLYCLGIEVFAAGLAMLLPKNALK